MMETTKAVYRCPHCCAIPPAPHAADCPARAVAPNEETLRSALLGLQQEVTVLRLRNGQLEAALNEAGRGLPAAKPASAWDTFVNPPAMTIPTRDVGGVLCRWWGDGPVPAGVAVLDAAAAALASPAEVSEGRAAATAVTLDAFKGSDDKWYITVKHPFGTSWVRMTDPRDVKLAELLAACPTPVTKQENVGKLFCDLRTDEDKYNFFLSGEGYKTGVIAKAIQNDVAMAYKRCAEFKKELAADQASPAKTGLSGLMVLTRAIDCLEILDKRPRPMCRDCADEDGVCPHGGLSCDMRKLIADSRAFLAAITKEPT